MFKRPTLLVLTAAAALAGARVAAADPLPAAANAAEVNAGLQAMRDYNLIVLKDLKSTSEVQGRTFVGGNLSGGSSNYLTKPGSQTGAALTVGGDVSGGAKNIKNGGSLKVGGDLTSGANMNGGGGVMVGGDAKGVNANGASVYAGGDVKNTNAQHIYYGGSVSGSNGVKHAGDHTADGLQDQIDAEAQALTDNLLGASAYLAGLTPTDVLTYSANGQQAIFDPGAGAGVAVFSLANLELALKNRSQLIFNAPTTYDAVIVNVAGSTVKLPSSINFNGPTGLGTRVIWNFWEATSVDLGSKSWYGSILAPNAYLKTNNFVEGTVVAREMYQNGAVRMGGFAAAMAIEDIQTAVPEPATWLVMILGFGAVGAMLRRRRAVTA
jgi:choice-of-anchor A domain-containing protein